MQKGASDCLDDKKKIGRKGENQRGVRIRPSYFTVYNFWKCGPGSVVGIATAYVLDGPRIESTWGEIFRTSPDRPWGPPSLLYNGYRVFPGGKVLPGRDADPSPAYSSEV